jgi:hypothetical protein
VCVCIRECPVFVAFIDGAHVRRSVDIQQPPSTFRVVRRNPA